MARTVAWIGVIGLALLIGGVLALHLIESSARSLLRARLGDSARIASFELGLGRFAAGEIDAELAGGAVRLQIPRVEGTYDLGTAWLRPTDAVREVTVTGSEVRVDLDRWLARRSEGGDGSSRTSDAGGGGTFAVPTGTKIRLEDTRITILHGERETRVTAEQATLSSHRNDSMPGSKFRMGTRRILIDHEGIGEKPLALPDLGIDGVVLPDSLPMTWVMTNTEIRFDEVVAALELSVARRDGGRELGFRLQVPRTRAKTLLSAIPAEALGPWSELGVEGEMEASLTLSLHTARLGEAKLDVRVRDASQITSLPSGLEAESYRMPFRLEVPDAGGARVLETGPGTDAWVPLQEVSPFVIHAILAHEDASFFSHHGFAPWAIETAFARNLERGKFAFGASTVSMQLAKNLFLDRDKTLTRKLREVIATYWLEKSFTKAEILELYLNVIEYGPGLYGLKNAARHYFAKTPAALSPAESVFLASILPSPRRFYRQYERNELSEYVRENMEFLLDHMLEKGRIDEAARTHGMQQIANFSFGRSINPELRSLPIGSSEALPCPSAPIGGRPRT